MQRGALLKKLIADSPVWTQNKLGAELGMSSANMSYRVNRSGMKLNLFIRILDKLGYDVVAVPKGSRLPNGSYKVEPDAQKESEKGEEDGDTV